MLTLTNEEIIKDIQDGIRVQENMYLLYSKNITLLKIWSKRYNAIIGEEDVLQECYIALHKAVQAFDLSMGYKFITYLQSAVKTHFSRVSAKSSNTAINLKDKRLLAQYIELNKKEQQAAGCDISINKAADLLQCSENDIQRILQYINLQKCASIDNPITSGSSDNLKVSEILPDKTNIEKDFEQQDNKEQLKQVWGYIGDICTDREQDIIKQHYKSNVTLTQLASNYGISSQRAGQIEEQALKKIRNDEQFRQWAKSFDYCIDMTYHYGFNTWRNNGASAVEMATEVRERYKNWMAAKEQREIEKQKSIMFADMVAKGLIPADCQYCI